jgi:hypothetical protein
MRRFGRSRSSCPTAAAKAGLNALTVGFAHALGPKVRVNAIMAGPFFTDIAEAWDREAFEAEAKATMALEARGQPVRGGRRGALPRVRASSYCNRIDPPPRRRNDLISAPRTAMVDYELRGRCALVTINRPEARNAVNAAVTRASRPRIDRIEADDDVVVGNPGGRTARVLRRSRPQGDRCRRQRPSHHRARRLRRLRAT